jgi:hypothetical protein
VGRELVLQVHDVVVVELDFVDIDTDTLRYVRAPTYIPLCLH